MTTRSSFALSRYATTARFGLRLRCLAGSETSYQLSSHSLHLPDESINIGLSVDPFRPMHVIHFPKAIICIYKPNQKLDMVEDDEADKEAGRVVQEVTKVLLDLGVLRKHIDDILEKSHTNVSSAVLHAFILVH